jgi:hypothetical protein
MAQIAPGGVSVVGWGTANEESVTWTAATATTATATFAKAHAAGEIVSNLSAGDTGFGAMENFAVKIDASVADGSDAEFYRIGRAASLRGVCYNCEPHTTVSRDWSQILWGSTWHIDGTSSATPVSAFWMRLGAAPPPIGTTYTITVNNVGSGHLENCQGSAHAAGASYSCPINTSTRVILIDGCGGSIDDHAYAGTMPPGNCVITAQFLMAPASAR